MPTKLYTDLVAPHCENAKGHGALGLNKSHQAVIRGIELVAFG